MCVDGWIPVDPLTLETKFPGVYAVGDVTSVGTPKAGVFAEGQAAVVADAIVAQHRGRPASETYDGRGICYLEFGDDEVARVEVTVPERRATGGAVRRTVGGQRGRQIRVRNGAHPPLVRPRLDRVLTPTLLDLAHDSRRRTYQA